MSVEVSGNDVQKYNIESVCTLMI